MAHFAKVLSGKVINVIVADQDFIDNLIETSPGEWIQTSYNTIGGVHYERNEDGSIGGASADQTKALRYNYAAVGGNYDVTADAFYSECPHKGWELDTDTYEWNPPTPYPGDDDNRYVWNEVDLTWDAVETE